MTFKDICHTLQQSSIIVTSAALQALPFSDVQRADVEFQPCHPSVESLLHRTLAWVDSSRQFSMLVISWPTVIRGVADRLKCAKLTFCFSLKYVSCGQMWQSSLDFVQCPWSSCPCSSSSRRLICFTVTSFTWCFLLYKCVTSWHPAECCAVCCPGGALSAPVTPIQHVLEFRHEWKTGYMCKRTFIYACWHSRVTEEMLCLSFHLLFFTSLEAVNWKKMDHFSL